MAVVHAVQIHQELLDVVGTPGHDQVLGRSAFDPGVAVEESLELDDMVREKLESLEDLMAGTIRTGCAETNAVLFVTRAMRTFSERYLLVDFRMHSGNTEDVSDRLYIGLVDFGILVEPMDKIKYDFVNLRPWSYGGCWCAMILLSRRGARSRKTSPTRLIISQQAMTMNGISG